MERLPEFSIFSEMVESSAFREAVVLLRVIFVFQFDLVERPPARTTKWFMFLCEERISQ